MEEQNIGSPRPYDATTYDTNPPPQQQNTTSSNNKRIDIQRLNHPTGVLTVINAVLLFLGACIMGGWRGALPFQSWVFYFHDGSTFYLVSTIVPFLLLLVLIVVYLSDLKSNFNDSMFSLVICINSALWASLVVIASSIVLANADKYSCHVWHCGHLTAAGIIGFMSAIGLTIKGVFNFIIYRRE